MGQASEHRILIVDDNRDVHLDFRKILCPDRTSTRQLDALEMAMFGEASPAPAASDQLAFRLDSAFQGQEGLALVEAAQRDGDPYALAFVDMRMPPGWDGVETISRLWAQDPDLQVVICSAYSDYSWREIIDTLGQSDGLLILKKPFESIEVVQVACAFGKKWALHRQSRRQTEDLQSLVEARTRSLEEVNRLLRAEMIEKARMESELRLAQKLEAVGRLASGVAHEINTPIQFVGDSLHFIKDAMADLARVLDRYAELHRAVGGAESPEAAAVTELMEEVDFSYLVEQVPGAIERSIEGLGRVATIVRSMKQFAHPDRSEMTAVDLNQAIQTTLTIARNEYKYVADIETDLGDIPAVICHAGEFNQAVLNILVNGAHAIADRVAGSEERGVIRVSTRRDGDAVLISIADTGGGIPPAIRDRIFDPFFTTKGVGRGTGQGLAIAHAVVVEKHGGDLTFESVTGHGTTFFIRLPIEQAEDEARVAG
ncbi:MAG TPA: ATP-binding protein [Kofleriaceae bacterium]|nr:ATP-binding protein [Kofleriaceae bacterium]